MNGRKGKDQRCSCSETYGTKLLAAFLTGLA